MPCTVGPVSAGQRLARLTSGNRPRRRLGLAVGRLVLVCVVEGYVVSAREIPTLLSRVV